MSTDTETSPIVKKIIESDEFRDAVIDIVTSISIDADNVEGLESAVEKVISNGDFEAETTVSFSA